MKKKAAMILTLAVLAFVATAGAEAMAGSISPDIWDLEPCVCR